MITALTVARSHVNLDYPGLSHKCLAGRIFSKASHVQAAWFDAISMVKTPYFFFIDDDDSLPDNYTSILHKCLEAGTAIAYTDELVSGEYRSRGHYSQPNHLDNPVLAHHLVLCNTSLAIKAINRLPRGEFWPEMMLYWEMAKLGGASYIPEIGYHWNRGTEGLHKAWFTVLGIHNSIKWCKQNP